jgi:hypothetical protein
MWYFRTKAMKILEKTGHIVVMPASGDLDVFTNTCCGCGLKTHHG